MSTTTFEVEAQDLGGNVKEFAGRATGDSALRSEGIADQIAGNAKQVVGKARDVFANPAPLADKAKAFAKDRPFATAALVGVVGVALLNTLRGR